MTSPTLYLSKPLAPPRAPEGLTPPENRGFTLPDPIMAKLLLVDDNQDLLGMQGEFLRMSGHEVETAVNGEEALAHAARSHFDLIVTDIIMPTKDGIEVIITLRKTIPALKVIAISGGGRLNAKDYLSIAQKLGAAATLAKPFSGSELVATVDRVLAG